jgi:hypothetical protein
MALTHFPANEPSTSPSRRWWLALFPRLSAATKRSLLFLSFSAALLASGQQLNLPARDPIGDEFQVNAYTTGNQNRPAVAMDGDGDFVVVWESNGSSGSDTDGASIQGQRYNSAGTAQGSQFQVNSFTTHTQRMPAVAMDSNGDFVVVWAGYGGGSDINYSIQGQRYNSAGAAQGSQFQVNSYVTSGQRYPSVAMDSNGDFIVIWDSYGSNGGDTNGRSIQGQRYNSSGTVQGGQFQVNSYTTNHQQFPKVAVDSDGDFVIVWQSNGSNGGDISGYSVQGRRYNSAGAPQSDEFQVNTYTTDYQWFPNVALDNNGDFVATWLSDGSFGNDNFYSIQGQRFNSNGTAQGSEFQINSYTTAQQGRPAVALNSDGDFVVVWHSLGSSAGDNSSWSIQGQRYNSSGTVQGGEFQINRYTTNAQFRPAIALDSDGDFVVVWYSNGSYGNDTDSTSIQGQRFTGGESPATPTPTPPATATNTPTPIVTATATTTATPSVTPTNTLTPSPAPTNTATPDSTPTATIAHTATPTLTATSTDTPTVTPTPTQPGHVLYLPAVLRN